MGWEAGLERTEWKEDFFTNLLKIVLTFATCFTHLQNKSIKKKPNLSCPLCHQNKQTKWTVVTNQEFPRGFLPQLWVLEVTRHTLFKCVQCRHTFPDRTSGLLAKQSFVEHREVTTLVYSFINAMYLFCLFHAPQITIRFFFYYFHHYYKGQNKWNKFYI